MTRQEVLYCKLGEFCDLLTCYTIFTGEAKEKKKKQKMSFDEIIAMR